MSSFDLNKIYKYIKTKTGLVEKPTKIFYLSLLQNNNCDYATNNDNFTVFNKVAIGPTNILQTSISPLFKEETLKNRIGSNSSTVTLFNYNKPTSQHLYNSSVSTIYRLNEGTIGISHAPLLDNFGNFYGLPKNIYEIAPITFGTGDYLNKNGFVLIASGNSKIKMILIYLLNEKCSIVDKESNCKESDYKESDCKESDCKESNCKETNCKESYNFNCINFKSTINLWTPNQNTQIIIKKNSLKVILNQTTSTPGILLPNIKVLSNTIKINFDIETSNNFNVNPFIKDLDGKIYYWINNSNYLIESSCNYIILSLPNNLINNSINIYLLATSNCNKINLCDSFTIHNFSIEFS
jgi:hypothetical protein